MTISIRTVTINDVPAINVLMDEIHRHHVEGEPRVFKGPDSPVYPPERIEQGLAAPDECMIGAWDSDQMVGFLWGQYREREESHTHQQRRMVFIDNLVVARSHHGTGVGRALMDAAEAWGRNRGATEAVLTVWQFNEGAIKFYERLGYESEQIRMYKPLNP